MVMMRRLGLAACLVLGLTGTGCVGTGGGVMDAAIVGDGVTTAVALAQPGLREANPLLKGIGGGDAVAAACVAASYAALHLARHFAPGQCEGSYRVMDGAKWGAVANNLAVLAGLSDPLAIGVLAAVAAYRGFPLAEEGKAFCQGGKP